MVDHDTRVWCAGFLDADGSIQIARKNATKGSHVGARPYAYELVVSVANCKVSALLPFLKWGGKIYHQNTQRNPNAAQHHVWVISKSKRCVAFLADIYPYLIVKQERAAVALQYAATQRGRGHKITDKEFVYRGFLWQRMRDLNKRGC